MQTFEKNIFQNQHGVSQSFIRADFYKKWHGYRT